MSRKLMLIMTIAVVILLVGAYLGTDLTVPGNSLLSIKGEGKDLLESPMGVAFDGDYLYVANSKKNQILVFNKKGRVIKQIGRIGEGKGELLYPVDVQISNDKLFVADFENKRIQIFSKNGEYISSFPGDLPIKPTAIAIKDGKIFVSDVLSQSIKVFLESGELAYEFDNEEHGGFKYPNGIAISSTGDEVYVSDSQNQVIKVFSIDGKFLKVLETSEPLSLPKGISQLDDKVYVVDALIHKIFVFNLEGKLLAKIGDKENTLRFPNDIFADDDHLYVADRGNNQVLMLNREE